jgi:hypothetical protein
LKREDGHPSSQWAVRKREHALPCLKRDVQRRISRQRPSLLPLGIAEWTTGRVRPQPRMPDPRDVLVVVNLEITGSNIPAVPGQRPGLPQPRVMLWAEEA